VRVKVEGIFVPESVLGSGGKAGLIISSQPLILCRRAGGPQSRSERLGEDMNFLPLPGIEPDSPVALPVALSLYLLSYPGFVC
jgi:hypothetical protein